MNSPDVLHSARTDRVIHLEDSRMRLRERSELISEAATAVTLLSSIPTAYARNEVDAFVILNGVAAAALAIVVVRSGIKLRRKQDAESEGTNVVGVFGGLTAVVEGLHRLHSAQFTFGHKHFALGIVTVLTGLFTATLALFMERLERRRSLTLSGEGVRMRLNKFRRFNVAWTDVTELRLDADQIRLIRTSGKALVVPLKRLINRDEVSEALVHAARSRGMSVVQV